MIIDVTDLRAPSTVQATYTPSTTGGDLTGSTLYYPWSYYPTEPSTCIGKAHVFECEHVKHCQCGKVERVMPKQKKGKKP